MRPARNLLAALFVFAFHIGSMAPFAGPAKAQEKPAQFRVIRSGCGTKSVTHNGEVQIQDPRTVFHVPADHQIVVFFEWEGPPGTHHAVGTWRSPDGKAALTSDFDLTSDGTRYMGTWSLAIPESIATGLWALEAQIDGQPAGTQAFQIVSDRADAAPPSPPPLPPPAEIYRRAAPASVFVSSLDADGEMVSRGFGVFVEKETILTAFQNIDGATSLRVDFADGSNATVSQILSWNRRQDWAVLKVDDSKVQPFEAAASNSWKVGDLCYILTSQGQGSRTIQNVNITGLEGTVPSAQRLTVSALGAGGVVGAPLLDGYGHLIGILGGGLAGVGSRRMGTFMLYADPTGTIPSFTEPTVLPLAQVPAAAYSQQPVALSVLAERGVLLQPVVSDPQAANGELCEDYRKVGAVAFTPITVKSQFSQKQHDFALVVTWGPTKKFKGMEQLRIFDSDNHPIAQTPPSKLALEPRVTSFSAWKIPLASFTPGTYRIDVLLDGQPQWREFFRVTD